MKTWLNMLPASYQRWRQFRLWLRRYLLFWLVAAGLTAVGVCYLPISDGAAQLARLDALERENDRLGRLKARLASTRTRLDDLHLQEGLVLELDNQPSALMVIGVVSRAARQSDGSVHVGSFSLERKSAAHGPRRTTVQPREGERLLTLQGTAIDNLSVARFVMALREPQVFASVELKSTGVKTAHAERAASYVLECVF